jgi:hypothetical protein
MVPPAFETEKTSEEERSSVSLAAVGAAKGCSVQTGRRGSERKDVIVLPCFGKMRQTERLKVLLYESPCSKTYHFCLDKACWV